MYTYNDYHNDKDNTKANANNDKQDAHQMSFADKKALFEASSPSRKSQSSQASSTNT